MTIMAKSFLVPILLELVLIFRCLGGETALHGRIPAEDMPKCAAVAESISPFFKVTTNEWRSGFRIDPPFVRLSCSSVPLTPEWAFWKLTPWPFGNKSLWVSSGPLVGTIGFIPLEDMESLQKQKYEWCTTVNIMTNKNEVIVLAHYQTNVFSRIILGVTCHRLSRHFTTPDKQVPYSAFQLLPEFSEVQSSLCERLSTCPAKSKWNELATILLDGTQHEVVRSAAAILAVESSDGQRVLPAFRKLANDKEIGPLLRCTVFAALANLGNAEDIAFIRQWSETAPLFYDDASPRGHRKGDGNE